ncbi:MAG TPA: hypothetical protein VM599_08585, partial [Thermoanaerobaculia bacterium]|nr:hypothetical protein [Thermoanaerobaculia bacterium]
MKRAAEVLEEAPGVEVPDAEGPPPPVPDRGGFRLADAAPWIAALIGGIGGIGALGYLRGRYQHGTLFLPDRYPDGVSEPGEHGLTTEDVWFRAADGVDLHGWWIGHPSAEGTLLYCHGSSGSIA